MSSTAAPKPVVSHLSLPWAVKKVGKLPEVEGYCQQGGSYQRPPKGKILETNPQSDLTTARARAV